MSEISVVVLASGLCAISLIEKAMHIVNNGSGETNVEFLTLYMLIGVEVFGYLIISAINFKFTFRVFPIYAMIMVTNVILRIFFGKF